MGKPNFTIFCGKFRNDLIVSILTNGKNKFLSKLSGFQKGDSFYVLSNCVKFGQIR